MALQIPFDESDNYARRLEKLRMPYDSLKEAIGQCHTERRMCSPDSAPTAKGYYAYNGMVVGLTTTLQRHGWERLDLNGVFPLWVNDELKIRLGVTSGTPMTGLRVPKHYPKTRYPKGALVRDMVERNTYPGSMPLFEVKSDETNDDPLFSYELWLTLMYFDKAKSEIRVEVSHPVEINARGIITGWNPRTTVPPYAAELPGDDDPNDGFGVEVPVSPR